MTSAQFQRVKELFFEIDALAPEGRMAALETLCSDDPVVRAEVEKLLKRDGHSRIEKITQQIDALLANAVNDNPADLIGTQIGPYEVREILGRGGMGVVYLAQDVRLSRKAALKAVLPSENREAMLARLRREARVLALLSHPNLATVYGLEEVDGQLFLAMEFIEGMSLSQRMGRNPLSIGDALQCCEQIAAGVEAAHEQGVIHRDLKPGNVMFGADGAVKVLDFGLARIVNENQETKNSTLSRKGAVFGTPAYMSPEQTRGEALSARTDIFSLGAILFRCLTGVQAFEGDTIRELMISIQTHEPDWSRLPVKTPESVRKILKRCLAKDPANRYRHIGDVRLDLRDAAAAKEWDRRPAASARTSRRALVAAIGAAAVALVAAAFLINRNPPAVETAAQRFDIAFPGNVTQADLERVQVALSRDGQNIAIACKTEAGQALWMRSHLTGDWRPVDKTENGHRPFFSPDGQWITFYRAGQFYKRKPTGGGDPIKITPGTNWYGATWTDDGDLVYASAWGDALHRISPGTSSPTPCTEIDAARNERSHVGPCMIPGTSWVLYNVWCGGETTDIYATDLKTKQKKLVVANASTPHVAATPRGDYLLFERASIIFAVALNKAAASVSGVESTIAEGVLNDGTRFAAYFDVASDGTLVYFPGTSFAEESRLAYVNADMTTEPINDDRMSFCEPTFYADGTKMAVMVKGKIYRTLLYDLKSKTREFLLTGGDTVSHCVSPDGKTLACTVNRDGGYGIDLYLLETRKLLGRIVEPAGDYPSDLCWSTDGKSILFSRAAQPGSPSDIWLVEARAGNTPRAFVKTTGSDIKPVTSPDGKFVAYASDNSGRSEIYLTTFPDGATTRQITYGGGAKPVWSLDGRSLFYTAGQLLMSVTLTPEGAVTGQPKLIYDKPFGQSDPIAREFTIAPDGRPLIVEPSERRPTVTHLKAITNWHRLLP
jgi:Tol biopolymer transport system component/predicted Ser/Thr protein kinase